METKYEKLVEHGDMCPVSTVSGLDHDALSSTKRSAVRARWVAVSLVMVGLLVAGSFLAVYFKVYSRLFNSPEFIKFQSAVKGNDDVMQEVYSSVTDNYVQYYTEPSPTQRYWILDDFNTDLQIIRSEENDQSICFVSVLNKKEAMAPTAVQPKYVPYKEHSHGIYTTDEHPVENKEFLGITGRRLCHGANVYWLRPMEDVIEVSDLSTNSRGDGAECAGSTTSLEHGGGHRVKRNIRSCATSCCWLVCCCDTHHFTWETSEHFTCKHVCQHCTNAYKQKIGKIC